ncbi:Tol-Pal system beta propeller repeat protein TolB [Inmirania thermothiophila]|uniref:Tol-Pal system protein TolB n=1 Tax=Inmirania thermothiophila TaxID=1750597 RepID=A0A3N1XT29_9GAMM|nr:Tol-Pal system beta propeller repeat protein TolB [Inmirania thermothiophila]ROR29795.1 TolB protein [Inmirania thermothiophila]
MRRILPLVALLLAAAAPSARAVLTIEITRGIEGALPIAVVPFGWQGPAAAPPLDIAAVVAADLRRSGRFAPLAERDLIARPTRAEEIRFPDWRALDAGSLLIGRLRAMGPDAYTVQFQLFDVFRGEQLLGFSIPARGDTLRRTAHRIADLVYERLTGERGAFDTRIAYVVALPEAAGPLRYELKVADSDGFDARTVLRSPEPLLSPAWSPDGERLAYVSFEGGRPAIYVQEIATGERARLASFAGINGAPAWSPDGRRMAMALSKDGNLEIYVMDLVDRSLRRITRSLAIDTEPVWAPDGRTLYFTSDRSGRPQIYRVPAAGGRPERVTFEGEYNARASVSPDGKRLALVNGDGGRYRVAVLELDTGLMRVLTDGTLDESPSFAPNGSMILYATRDRGRGVLAAVSVDGRVQQRLVPEAGDVREPAWSPFNQPTE